MRHSKQWFRDATTTWADMEERTPDHAKYRHYSSKILKPERKCCLDVGCGWGRYLKEYIKKNASLVVGMDLNLENLNKCKEISGVDLVRGDIENLPFKKGTFDIISCIGTTEHLPNPDRAMKEFSKVLNNLGGLLCVTWNNYNWFSSLWDSSVRKRLIGATRDIIGKYLPSINKPRVHRNLGFSLNKIRSLHYDASLEIFNQIRVRNVWYIITFAKSI